MEAEASSFETSEMLASFLASTQLISESWKLCDKANTTAPGSLIVGQIGVATCIAFSGIQTIEGMSDPCIANLVPLNCASTNRMFSILERYANEGDENRVLVHSGLLHLFVTMYSSSTFHDQILSIVKNSKSLIITGHSIGGAMASLTTLYLLCYLQSISLQIPLLCITFGSPLLGNDSLSRAILRQRWGGNFCHVITKHDIMPRLFLVPLENYLVSAQLHSLFRFWHFSMSNSSPNFFTQILPEKVKIEVFNLVSSHLNNSSVKKSLFWPFGNYVFCCGEGAFCVDNSAAIVNMLDVMFMKGSPSCSVEDHLKYGEYVGKVSLQFLSKIRFMEGEEISASSYEAGLALALQSSGIAAKDDLQAKECLKMARWMGQTPNLNCANLAISLSKITPYRVQIEWYKTSCDESHDQLGYYDSFKQRQVSKRDSKINMIRYKLGGFWNNVIHMLDNNQLPHDFDKLSKWVNASQFYQLLVEPLDIAEYYREGTHKIKGHYMANGRERRYEIFDRWWREKRVLEKEKKTRRSKFASLTQDSCFWARVEEAREWLEEAKGERNAVKVEMLRRNLEMFEMYARELVESKEVSVDVVAKKSSYILWVNEWMELKQQL